MQVAHWVSGKNATVARLTVSALYILSAPSTPKEFTTNVLNRVDAGHRVSLRTIRQELKAVRGRAISHGTDADSLLTRNCGNGPWRTGKGHGNPAVAEAVSIVAAELSERDFSRVREIMTSRSVLMIRDFRTCSCPHSRASKASAVNTADQTA
jgi:hypothetical protein